MVVGREGEGGEGGKEGRGVVKLYSSSISSNFCSFSWESIPRNIDTLLK